VSGTVIRDSFPSAFTGVTYTATQSGGAFGFNASGSGNLFVSPQFFCDSGSDTILKFTPTGVKLV
jgi:hypothetical protein